MTNKLSYIRKVDFSFFYILQYNQYHLFYCKVDFILRSNILAITMITWQNEITSAKAMNFQHQLTVCESSQYFSTQDCRVEKWKKHTNSAWNLNTPT